MRPGTRLYAVVALAISALAACHDVEMNRSCTSDCFTVYGIDGDTPEQIDAKVKQMCESMGRKGKPEITERGKKAAAGHCTA